MKKKIALLNFVLMLSVLFAVSYQSVHYFSHHSHNETKEVSSVKSFTKNITEQDDCPICDFKFVSFLSSEILSFTFFPLHFEIPYQFSIKESVSFFCGSLFSLRGPPELI